MRFDIGVNMFAPQPGQLYYQDGTDLVAADPPDDRFQPEQGFWGPFRIHFSIGQAF